MAKLLILLRSFHLGYRFIPGQFVRQTTFQLARARGCHYCSLLTNRCCTLSGSSSLTLYTSSRRTLSHDSSSNSIWPQNNTFLDDFQCAVRYSNIPGKCDNHTTNCNLSVSQPQPLLHQHMIARLMFTANDVWIFVAELRRPERPPYPYRKANIRYRISWLAVLFRVSSLELIKVTCFLKWTAGQVVFYLTAGRISG